MSSAPPPEVSPRAGCARVLCVDLDGTLIRTDLLHETFVAALKIRPTVLIEIGLWLISGRAFLKDKLSCIAKIAPESLPYNEEVLNFVRQERLSGRRIALATASHRRLAEPVANHLGLFDVVVATENDDNMGGRRKAERLTEIFGTRGFDYIGDSAKDIPVWTAANTAMVVGTGAARGASRAGVEVAHVFPRTSSAPSAIARAVRPHQWLKNLLLFAVLIAAHQTTNWILWQHAAIAFLCFGFCASSVYLLNDLFDLEADRRHPRKRLRPLAAGDLSVSWALALIPVFLLTAFALSFLLPPIFTVVLAIYYATTLIYSIRLKRMVMVDVMTLAGLYTLRIVAGGAAVNIKPSFWLLAFSMFLFLSLALAKRYAELLDMRKRGLTEAEGRGYRVTDEETLVSLGAASGYVSVLVVALYINGETARDMYLTPEAIWLICPLLLYWISRVWMAARRGKLTDDPVVFAMKDNVSRLTFALAGAIYLIASTTEIALGGWQ